MIYNYVSVTQIQKQQSKHGEGQQYVNKELNIDHFVGGVVVDYLFEVNKLIILNKAHIMICIWSSSESFHNNILPNIMEAS